MTATDLRDVHLTIVPTDMDEAASILDTIVDGGEEMPRLRVAAARKHGGAKPVPVFAPAATPAPAPSRLPAAVAGLMGGVVLGGVGVAAMLALAVGAAAVAGGATWWWMSAPAVAVDAVEAVAPVVDEEAAADPDAGVEPVAGPATEAPAAAPGAGESTRAPAADPRKDAPAAAPEAPVAAPARPPVAPVEDPEEAVPAMMSVKLLSDPPAATVLVDGVNVGRTPLKADLPPGSHTVTIESGKAVGTFTIDAGTASRFCFEASGRKVTQSACN